MRKIIVLMVVVAVFAVMMPVEAQDGLSAEEIALVDRAIAASDAHDELGSYQLSGGEESNLDMSLALQGQEIAFGENYEITTEGYYLYDGEIESISATSELVFNSNGPDGEVNFSITADLIGIGATLYVNAELVDGENPDGGLEEGWLTIESADEIPLALDNFGLDDFFDDSEDDPAKDRDQIISHASSVTLEKDELDNGTPVEVITVLIDGDNLLDFFAELSADDDSDNPFVDAIFSSDVGGQILLMMALDADDNMVGEAVVMSLVIESLDMSAVELEGLPADVEISLTMDRTKYTEYSALDGEFEAIEAPTE